MDSLRPENTHKTKFREGNYTKINYCASDSREAQKIKTRHELEREYLDKKYEAEKQRITAETSNNINKEKAINIAKELLYSNLGINSDQNKNSPTTNFLKGMIDGLVIGNIDLAIEVYNTNGKILLDALKSLINVEGITQMAKTLGENIGELFNGNAYKKGKNSVELIMIGTGIASAFKLTRFLVKGTKKIATKVGETGSKLIEKGIEAGKNISGLSIKEILNLNGYERLMTIAGLEINKRLEIAGKLIKRNLTKAEEGAIEAAHKVGEDRTGAGVGNYLATEIKKKIQILKDGGFSLEERKALLFEGVCGGLPKAEQLPTWKRLVTIFEGSSKSIQEAVVGSRNNFAEQLGVIPKIVEKSLVEVNRLFKGEAEIIKNAQESLRQMYRGVDINDRFVINGLNKKVNEWISLRLSNLEKIITYVEEANLSTVSKQELIGATNHLKKELIAKGLSPLGSAIKEQMDLGNLSVNYLNKTKMVDLIRRLRLIESYNITN